MPSTDTTMEERFSEQFPAMGVAGDPKDNCIYRFDQYVNDKSLLLSFIEAEISSAVAGERERVLQALIEASEPYDGSKWHNTLTVEHIKEVLSTLTP